jgi:molybdenum cofactor cytidylyltransferase
LIALIIPAAGMSERFGRNKLLEKINESTVIENVVSTALKSIVDEVTVVVGFESEKILNVIQDKKCKILYNENFQEGPSFSVRKGVRSVVDRADAVLIQPGDVAFVTSDSINLVIEWYLRTKNPIVVAAHNNIPGHPILFDKSLFNEILEINEETKGLKSVVRRHQNKVLRVETGSREVLIDIDTQEDIRKYRAKDDS